MNILEFFTSIRTFVFDVDGVLTDGSLLLTENGEMLRSMNIKDGYAMQLAIKKGYKIWVISGGQSEAVKTRLQKLGLTDIYIGIDNKKEVLLKLIADNHTLYESILYLGDDIPDYAVMQLCALACCPNDAVPEIKQVSKYISPYPGGKGCVRDVIEKVLKLNGHWELPD
jgi:3-deoxy-D-manno-octulosonate 8-phosphate phosphatase (KDO 8-P phosphatase)